jgi:hypothetical protein
MVFRVNVVADVIEALFDWLTRRTRRELIQLLFVSAFLCSLGVIGWYLVRPA